MEKITVVKLKKGLSLIKKNINAKIGPVWKLRKPEVINKLKNLNYKYDIDNKQLKTDSMIRKTRVIQL